MITLENGEITDLEYQSNLVGTVWVCQVCRRIFTSHASIRAHNRTAHDGLGDRVGADILV